MDKHLKWLNPGAEKIREAVRWKAYNGPRPAWTNNFPEGDFSVSGDRLLYQKKIMLTQKQKQLLVKEAYFHPQKQSTIDGIWRTMGPTVANLTRSDVGRWLQGLLVYQLKRSRVRPKPSKDQVQFRKPGGIIAVDTVFTSKDLGWKTKRPILVVVECWSGYLRAFPLRGTAPTKKRTNHCMQLFFQELMRLGARPRGTLWSDKGSEFADMGKFCAKWGIKYIQSPTGGPVTIVESYNKQIMERLTIHRNAKQVYDAGELCGLVTEQMNNRPRRRRNNMSPVQLLALSPSEVKKVNMTDSRLRRVVAYSNVNMRPLKVGDVVRYLWWTRKEQVKDLVLKGYENKWSDTLHRVVKIRHNKKGMALFRLSEKIGARTKDDIPFPTHRRYRWELQYVNLRTLDTTPPKKLWQSEKGKIVFENMELAGKDAQQESLRPDANAPI